MMKDNWEISGEQDIIYSSKIREATSKVSDMLA